jgi:16S rRNA (guanine527-N7)-methyltransferase
MRPDELNFIKYLEQLNIQLTSSQYEKLFFYLHELLIANRTSNLTAINDYAEALTKHLYDSLLILNQEPFVAAHTILDVGSGGGLPGIPLAICHPKKNFVSIEATRKKVNFQLKVGKMLHLANHTALWGRCEEYAHNHDHREQYDLVLARALAATATLAELTLPFVAPKQYALFYKGKDYLNELEIAFPAIKRLGGSVSNIETVNLPDNTGVRNLIIIRKISASPTNLPRRSGLPQKKPLK